MEHRQRDVEDKDSLRGGDTLVSRLGGLCDQSLWADCTGPKVAHDHSLEVAQEGKRLGAKNDTWWLKYKSDGDFDNGQFEEEDQGVVQNLVSAVPHPWLRFLEPRVLDSMTDKYLDDPLLSCEGGQGAGRGSHLFAS